MVHYTFRGQRSNSADLVGIVASDLGAHCLLTFFNLMDYPIRIDTICMEQIILYFKELTVKVSINPLRHDSAF